MNELVILWGTETWKTFLKIHSLPLTVPDPVNPRELSTLNSNKDLRWGELQIYSSLLFQLQQKKNIVKFQ